MDELLARIGTAIDFGQGTEPGIGTEHEVHAGAGPLDGAGGAVAAFKEAGVS